MENKKLEEKHDQLIKQIVQLQDETRQSAPNTNEQGTSGTEIYSGYYDEEYLQQLQGTDKADEYDKISRSDSQVQMLLSARMNPILSANWFVEAASADDNHVLHKEFIEYEMFKRCNKPWEDTLEEALSFIKFGFCVFERVNEVVKGDPKFGDYIGIKKLAWRSQRTIERWNLNKDGTIHTVEQQAFGDLESNIEMKGEDLIVMTLRKTGDNYEGISALRPIYGNWLRKRTFLKLLAIGIERYAVSTPIGTIPAGKEQSPEKQIFETILKRFTSHEKSFITKSEGWEIEFPENKFDADKIKEVILYEDLQMAKAFVATHLELGTGGNGGAYALGSDLSDQFLSIIQNDANIISRSINKHVIRELIDMNFGPQECYPELRVTGINDKLGKESAEIFKILKDAGMISTNNNLEIFLRKEYDLPSLTEEELQELLTSREPQEPTKSIQEIDEITEDIPEELESTETLSELGLQLQLKESASNPKAVKRLLDASTEMLSIYMDTALKDRVSKALSTFQKKLEATPRSKWSSLAFEYSLPSRTAYATELRNNLSAVSRDSLNQVIAETPPTKQVKLSEEDYKGLPKGIRNWLGVESKSIALTQDNNLESKAIFTFTGSIDEGTDVAVIIDDMKQAQEKAINGSLVKTGAVNVASKTLNKSRFEYFQYPEVLAQIEAFEFLNVDPKTDICRDLAGRVFRKDDPRSQQYLPPLHHNCKSYIGAIYIDVKPETVSDLIPSERRLLDQITLQESIDPDGNRI